MFLLWTEEPNTRMDYVRLGRCLVGNNGDERKPDMAIITLDEMENFCKKYGSRGVDIYNDYVNTEVIPAIGGNSPIFVNEYNQLCMFDDMEVE